MRNVQPALRDLFIEMSVEDGEIIFQSIRHDRGGVVIGVSR
ncbi:MAG: hypothetical protein WCK85_03395 [Chlorobium sp.]